MALISCSECGKEISDKAVSCPGCGCPVESIDNLAVVNNEEVEDNIKLGILSLIFGVAGIFLACAISEGLLLIITLPIFIVSIILSRKCYKWYANIGNVISVIGIFLIVLEFIKPIIFSIFY